MDIPNGFFRTSIKAIIKNSDGKIMLFREDNGFWDFPGGAMNFGETPQEALRREVKEECGLSLTKVGSKPKHVLVFKNFKDIWVNQVFFEAEIESGEIVTSTECLEVKYFNKNDIEGMAMFPSVVKFFNRYED